MKKNGIFHSYVSLPEGIYIYVYLRCVFTLAKHKPINHDHPAHETASPFPFIWG